MMLMMMMKMMESARAYIGQKTVKKLDILFTQYVSSHAAIVCMAINITCSYIPISLLLIIKSSLIFHFIQYWYIKYLIATKSQKSIAKPNEIQT